MKEEKQNSGKLPPVPPDPGAGFRLLEVGESLGNAELHVSGSLWMMPDEFYREGRIYTHLAKSIGLFYRVPVGDDPEKDFQKWIGNLLLDAYETNDYYAIAKRAWLAAKDFYSK